MLHHEREAELQRLLDECAQPEHRTELECLLRRTDYNLWTLAVRDFRIIAAARMAHDFDAQRRVDARLGKRR